MAVNLNEQLLLPPCPLAVESLEFVPRDRYRQALRVALWQLPRNPARPNEGARAYDHACQQNKALTLDEAELLQSTLHFSHQRAPQGKISHPQNPGRVSHVNISSRNDARA